MLKDLGGEIAIALWSTMLCKLALHGGTKTGVFQIQKVCRRAHFRGGRADGEMLELERAARTSATQVRIPQILRVLEEELRY